MFHFTACYDKILFHTRLCTFQCCTCTCVMWNFSFSYGISAFHTEFENVLSLNSDRRVHWHLRRCVREKEFTHVFCRSFCRIRCVESNFISDYRFEFCIRTFFDPMCTPPNCSKTTIFRLADYVNTTKIVFFDPLCATPKL